MPGGTGPGGDAGVTRAREGGARGTGGDGTDRSPSRDGARRAGGREPGTAVDPGSQAGLAPLERTLRLHRLYDLYRGLLTPRQRDVFELYHWQDLSLGEVAEHLGISRQAVHDLLRRSEAALEEAEGALGLGAWRQRAAQRLEGLDALLTALAERLAAVEPGPGPGAGRAGTPGAPAVRRRAAVRPPGAGPALAPGPEGAPRIGAGPLAEAGALVDQARRVVAALRRDLPPGEV
ncbi:helix-turn-helix protein YlxM/p13 family protein [Thermaerobacter marianensis DSM 12885]|uniref:UPF0122 protein Tmar_0956 n=1 Tax=Thermaerobacter marianensis (strain ATCC 700841 / DSM 12885 / JCM 10246 / 7p75a) TaxID=644966 RepID=E6SJE1_THEM7|nr:sigma factor-like helix-turn-helix DNA-binding protein [Thermaerobacter marianensis]ADU51069.1 helix-turn-helix protein YlxM/p13 family protein [Thermaerobacter marianensis DSM 12885]